jgi:hypothetical protein
MSYRAEDGAAASGLAINLPDSISPELLKAAMEITSSLHRLAPNVNVNKEAVTVGRGAAGAIAVNVYEAKKKCPDRDMISASSAFTSDEELLTLVKTKTQPVDQEVLQKLSRRPKEEENFEMAFLILDDWEELKVYITPNSEQFKRRTRTIEADKMADTHKKAKRFLDMWVATFGIKANVYRLCKVLVERGKKAHAEDIFGIDTVAIIDDPDSEAET